MEYRSLGSAGVKISPVCLGTMMFGGWGNPDRDDCARIIHRAMERGINFIDTANIYSLGESEEIVGQALKGRRNEVVLATKVWGRMGEGPNDRGLSRQAIQQQVEASLRRLATEVIDLYQIHRPDPSTPWEETLSALDDLVRQGKVRYIGCSTNHYDVAGQPLLRAWQIVETLWLSELNGWERFVSLQPPYSILRRTMELEHFPMTRRFGLANITWSPLEGGWLTGKYRRETGNPEDSPRSLDRIGDLGNPKFARRLDVVEELLALAADRDVPLAQFSLAWVLANPDVTSVIVGPRTGEQLDSCLRALELEITDEDRQRIDSVVPPGQTVL